MYKGRWIKGPKTKKRKLHYKNKNTNKKIDQGKGDKAKKYMQSYQARSAKKDSRFNNWKYAISDLLDLFQEVFCEM